MKLECKLIGEGCEQLADLPENCKYFLWLINHESLSVGKWLQEEAKMALVGVATMIQNRLNIACWSYSYTNMIWERIIHILASCGMEGLISFGYAIWWSLQKNAWMCGVRDFSLALIVHRTHQTWTTIGCTQIWGS